MKKEKEKELRLAIKNFEEAAIEHGFCNGEWPVEERKRARRELADARQWLIKVALDDLR